MFLDGQCAETHLQAVQDSGKGGRPGYDNLIGSLQFIQQGGAAHYFCINAFEGKEHNAEIGRRGGSQVFVGNVFSHLFDGCFEQLACRFDSLRVGIVVSVQQLFINIFGKFGVDGEVNVFADIVAPRELDGKFHDRVRTFAGVDVRFVLFRCQYLFQQHAQLYFSDVSSCLHIAQYPFQAAYVLRQRLHFP